MGSLTSYPYINYCKFKAGAFAIDGTNCTVLIWNVKCSLLCQLNGCQTVIPSNTLVLLTDGDQFSCQDNCFLHVKTIGFNAAVFSSSIIFICGFINTTMRKGFNKKTPLLFPDVQTQAINHTFTIIEELFENKVSLNIKAVKDIIRELLNDALAQKFKDDESVINHFGKILNTQFAVHHNVVDYAKTVHMEPKNLLRLFQKLGLQNPSVIIKQKLMLEIKSELIYTNKSIRDICFGIGFSDPAYFSRFFKKNTGITLKGFRKKYPNKAAC